MRSIFSYHFGKQFNVCFTEAKICTRPFGKQQTVPSDCLRLSVLPLGCLEFVAINVL